MRRVAGGRSPTVLLVGLAVVAAGCGDDGDGGDASNAIEATAQEYEFTPAAWTVNAGEEFEIDFTNDGTVEHEWAVIALGEDIASEEEFTEARVMLEVEAIDAGTTTTESFTIDEPGTYQVICAIETHFDQGMQGSLTVE